MNAQLGGDGKIETNNQPLSLFEIQTMAKSDKAQAEVELLAALQVIFCDLAIASVRINQSAVSLNSINGIVVIAGVEYFFKFHSEEGEEQTMQEYYRSELLSEAGYAVMMPVYKSTESGKQILIYPKVDAPTLFQAMDQMDRGYLVEGKYPEGSEQLLQAEREADRRKVEVLLRTLKLAPAAAVAAEGINQLFYVRLADKRTTPRVDLFYRDKAVRLPDGGEIGFNQLSQLKWVINGVAYDETLEDLIQTATGLLDPLRLAEYPVVTAHGDDHNGNKFVTPEGLIYLDPAFAGMYQYALLSQVKTTFHDTLAHPLWLYNPQDFAVQLELKIEDGMVRMDNDFNWQKVAPLREQMLQIKLEEIWIPLLRELKKRGWLEENWENYLRKALFACPFLVYNLIDNARYTTDKSLFALAQAVRMGSKSKSGMMEPFLEKLRTAIEASP